MAQIAESTASDGGTAAAMRINSQKPDNSRENPRFRAKTRAAKEPEPRIQAADDEGSGPEIPKSSGGAGTRRAQIK